MTEIIEPFVPDWLKLVLNRIGYGDGPAMLTIKSEADEAELFKQVSNKVNIFTT